MSKDTIYRADAIGAINYWFERNSMPQIGEGILYGIPSADKQQGEWKYQFRDSENEEYRCSLCNYPQCYKSNYCPSCGARMFAKGINVPDKEGADDE